MPNLRRGQSGAGCPPGPVDRIDGADADADDVREPPAPALAKENDGK